MSKSTISLPMYLKGVLPTHGLKSNTIPPTTINPTVSAITVGKMAEIQNSHHSYVILLSGDLCPQKPSKCPISIEMSPVLIALELSSPGAATFALREAQPRVTRMLRH